jgi:ATP-binding cassette subfamily E protein 1
MPFGVREGINIFLAGFVPTENLRFRPEELTFKVSENEDERLAHVNDEAFSMYEYPSMVKTQGGFTLNVDGGSFTDSEIVVLLGENGTGKTTFIRLIAGLIKPDDETIELPEFNVSYKPQKIAPKFEKTVRDLRVHQILEGTNEIMRVIVARGLKL